MFQEQECLARVAHGTVHRRRLLVDHLPTPEGYASVASLDILDARHFIDAPERVDR